MANGGLEYENADAGCGASRGASRATRDVGARLCGAQLPPSSDSPRGQLVGER